MYLNTIVYISGLGVCSVFGVICSIALTIIPGAQRLNTNYYVARSFYLYAGTLTGIRYHVEGEENFEKGRPGVLVGNHQTGIDILYLGRIFPKMASIMAKQELKYAPLLGQFMSLSGAVFIDRKNRHDAVKAFNQVGAEMKKRKLSLWIFPEGTRSNLPFPDLLPFKKGAFHLAVQAQVPIVPVVCENYNRLFDGKTRFEGGTIRIKVLEPISTQGLGKDDVNDLTTRVRELMLKELKEMDAQRDSFDTSSIATRPPSSTRSGGSLSVPSNVGIGPEGLGGIAGFMARIVGTGHGRDLGAAARKDSERLRRAGTSGQRPDDYGLLSESAKASGVQQGAASTGAVESAAKTSDQPAGSTNRRPASSVRDPNGSGSDETDGSTVLVGRPAV
ncbi:1-acylglycerol-3-phosphate o-acyltransferase [Ceraceosorus bombacis]|uniref:1-acyl-sn-glycerol-3-phosphate acyltransferase n=1 Tax=Ceraceosorus bombacis TaxID=401625 RepID=A0A0P1BMZ6_9BASI|nr:1-acylglycerol-3-phosphate o-acyltransferase [Ceraceosorus bombacis]